ncbi:MAG: hypothetical protein CM15mP116_00420 [Synechococcus sp.]|nr:MAG: hypothetical protein CM15mP116_00420 [Synechococcus sp.]
MRTVTWSLIGTTVFGVAWLAWRAPKKSLSPRPARTCRLVQDIQMPVGGVVDQILVEEGDAVKAGQVLMKLDTEATRNVGSAWRKQSSSNRNSLVLRIRRSKRSLPVNTEQLQMLENNLQLQIEILERYQELEDEGAASELQFLSQRNTVEEIRGRLIATKADRLRQEAQLDQQVAQLNSELADLRSRLAEARVTLRYQLLQSPWMVWCLTSSPRPKASPRNQPRR